MRARAMLAALVLTSASLVLAHLLLGPGGLSLAQIWPAAWGGGDAIDRTIVWEIRAPRAVCALLVGASLGLCGAALQGLLRNPLADAGVIGVSGAASLGAVIAFAMGWVNVFVWSAPLLAIAFALITAAIVCGLGLRYSGASTLILIGVGVSSLAGAGIALALNLAPSPLALSDLVNWTLGSLANRSWADVALAAPFMMLGAAFLFSSGRALAAMSLGDESARSMGVSVARTRVLIILGVGLLAGAATAMAGVIGFIGVAAPHLVRARFDHDPARILSPAALMGAALTLLADLGVRLAPFDQPLALGVVAALLGAPIFMFAAAQLARTSP